MKYTFFTFRECNKEIIVSQIDAEDANSAVTVWRKTLPFATLYDENIEDDNFTAMEGLQNCWCTSCLDETDNLVIADFVLTHV